MKHHSFPTCDDCGQRHVSGDKEQCIEDLKETIESLEQDLHEMEEMKNHYEHLVEIMEGMK